MANVGLAIFALNANQSLMPGLNFNVKKKAIISGYRKTRFLQYPKTKNFINHSKTLFFMNTYSKFCPNVFLAKCPEQHEKGEEILITTKYGKENACIVFNLFYENDGFFYYSIVRADGFDFQAHAAAKAAKLHGFSDNAAKRSDQYYLASQEGKEFLSLGEPIHVGHHSESRHRALIDRNHNRMRHCIDESTKAEDYKIRAAYWAKKANLINLSMPECLDFYEFELEKARSEHAGFKNGSIPRNHSYSLAYASKKVYELEKNLILARRLWA